MIEEIPDIKPYSQRGYATITINGVTSPIVPEKGYELVKEGDLLKKGDKPYDYYAGWIEGGSYHWKNGHYADSAGRWLAWERKIK